MSTWAVPLSRHQLNGVLRRVAQASEYGNDPGDAEQLRRARSCLGYGSLFLVELLLPYGRGLGECFVSKRVDVLPSEAHVTVECLAFVRRRVELS